MNSLMKTALLAAAALTPAVASAQNVPAAVVAVVDTQRIYSQCNACRTAQTQIQALVTQAQQRAQALGQPLQTEGQAIETEAQRVNALAAGQPKTTATTALQQRAQAFQARQQSAQQELQRLESNIQSVRQNVVRQINERLGPIVSQVMTQRGANLAVDQQATLAAARSVDVTDAVLAALNTALPTVSVTPLPAQANAPATNRPATPGR